MDIVRLDQLRQLAIAHPPSAVISNGLQPSTSSAEEENNAMALDGGKLSPFVCRIKANEVLLRVRPKCQTLLSRERNRGEEILITKGCIAGALGSILGGKSIRY